MSRPRKRARCDRPSPLQRQRLEDRVVTSEGVEGFTTPPRGAVAVNVEEVRSVLLDLTIDNRTSRSDSTAAAQAADSPRSTKKHQLQKRRLFAPRHVQQPSWSLSEEQALVSFLLFYGNSDSWVSRRGDTSFWDGAARYIQNHVNSAHLQTGLSFSVHLEFMYMYDILFIYM